MSGLAPVTTYSMTVVARDHGGNTSPPSAALAVLTPADTTVPAKPANLAASAVTTTSFALTWSASTDNVGVVGYNIYRAGVLVGSAAGTSFDATGLAADTIHRMTVRARDAAGNLSASAALSVRTLAEPPSSPTALNVTGLKAASFTLKWTAATGGTGGIAGYDVYRDGVLAGTTTKKSFAFTAQTPATSYSLSVTARDHEDRVSAPSAALSVTTPPDTTKPTVPKDLNAAAVTHVSFALQWTPSTDNVGVTGYEVLRNNVVIGSPAIAAFAVTGLSPLTTYSLRVRAKDAAGNVSGNSAILSVTTAEVPNVAPTITLTAPVDGSSFTLPVATTLSATAADSDGTIARVEFFDGMTSLGVVTTPSTPPATFTLPLALTVPGLHSLRARATDNRNSTTDSAPAAIHLLPGLPYLADFEETEGYVAGPLDDQQGWMVAAGSAAISAGDAAHGEQSILLEPGATAAWVDQEIGAGATNPSPVFVDLYSRPAAGTDIASGSRFDLDGGRLAFVLQGASGRFAALDGNGADAGTWTILPGDLPLDASHLASAWTRLTARLDYGTKKWDFYVDGRMLAADLGFRLAGATYLGGLSFQGHSALGTGIDDLYAGPDNPLFADADHDGMDDAWETAHGLDPAVNDRNADPDGDGLGNVIEYVLGTDPQNADSDSDGLTDGQERSLGTNPLSADSDGDGIPDGWEHNHGLDPLSDTDAAGDADHDGQTNLEEFQFGTDPADYYNGAAPVITVVAGGEGTPGTDGLLQVLVSNASGQPLADAPVTFAITAGSSKLAASVDAGASLVDTLPFRTLADGTASAYYRTPSGESPAGAVNVTAGGSAVDLTIQDDGGGTNELPYAWFNTPEDGQEFDGTGDIVLTAGAYDSDGSVAKVEFFAGETKLGEATAEPYVCHWTGAAPGTYTLTVRATDDQGATGDPGSATVTIAGVNPVDALIDFESAEGYAAGPLSGQQAWSSSEGVVVGAESAAPSGANVLSLGTSSSGQHALEPVTAHGIVFVDFHARLAIGAEATGALTFYLGGALLAVAVGDSGADVLAGQTGESYNQDPTGTTIPLDANHDTGWHRFTLRLNYATRRWDLYLDGAPIAADLNLARNPLDAFNFGWTSWDAAETDSASLDRINVTGVNPLFTDADRDGMDDAWEVAHGLDPTRNDRDGDLDRDGLTNVQEYVYHSDPHLIDSDGDGMPDHWEVDHGMNPGSALDATQDADGDGLSNLIEYKLGTDIHQDTSDASGIPDAELDFDGDGIDNLREVQQGTDPTDYYNGHTPVVTPLADYSEQLGPDGLFAVRVTDSTGQILVNAPIQFTTTPESLLTQNPYGSGSTVTLVARTGDDGIARVYVRPVGTEVP